MKILHLSDIHIGSGFCHGRVNPATGLNTRLEDFVKTLSLCIDRAIANHVDLVLFGGDAFPNATPAPYVQEAFANQFRRLVDADIPTVLLVGNHDQHSQGLGGASLNIYRTLGVPGFVVGDTLTTHRISTRSGDVQIITLPWLTRSTLMTRQETQGSSLAEVNQLLTDRLEVVIEGEIRRLDPDLPTVLLAHLMADNATLGAERLLAVGKGFTLPLSLLTRPCFDYVALGHVHKHQNLNKSNDPPVIYPGSIERVDFSEEKEDKGYVMIDLEKGKADWEFCPLPVRTFRTIEIDLSKQDDPQKALLKGIAKYDIQDNVVRLIYKLKSEQLDLIDNSSLHQALSVAHTYTIQAELVSQLAKPRIPELSASSSIDPMSALKTYLNNREDLQEIMPSMLEAAHNLLADDEGILLVPQGGIKN
ncbi:MULTISPECIES: exonuclease subunit SbcD [Nostocales]|jgi:exonuclease SbcD|uniref:exonuclease subunit SbcD n=1 Tax=Nostocales TaxID=1161 RepID=UPI00029B63AC|nr:MULTISPECIES: exonuclease SbcCD subunit D [Nostocales]MBO1054828.1 exonuclease SbcCD subunit D [Dolichospermum sp. DET73]MBS9383429.1 exonuclease SbcCD subunit D [Dolichospermum sp. BR01]AFW96582.1 nuclease SbcCD subunit D [Anabaena sp. 90]MTJ17430.1 exonuclease SbcCD subunit D [Dolichospermum sp. UHCC 0299]MTJ38174.1 exonuclease SbcCD subunit D [Dolichospermum sp. UHCC 0406]